MDIKKIKRVALGQATPEEQEEVNAWTEMSEERKRLLADAKAFYNKELPDDGEITEKVKCMWERRRVTLRKRRSMSRSYGVGIAASVLVIVGIAFWMIGKNGNIDKTLVVADHKEVRLILPDGSAHDLSVLETTTENMNIPGFRVNPEGTIQEIDMAETDVTKVKYNEIIVPRGGEYSLTLADGTIMKLNSDTRVKFPNSFIGTERRVFLDGEAYFEVARDEMRPFLVEFSEGVVQVLGTHFNVKARREQNAFTTLVSGKVQVSSGSDSVVLKPGEYCEIDTESRQLSVHEADLMAVLAWKNGEFVFKDASLEYVMNELAAWYDMEVIYASEDLKHIKLHIYMDRTRTLDEALQIISKLGSMTYQIQGKKVIVKKQ